MSAWRILRWPVPIDDDPHPVGTGEVVLVAARTDDQVDVWTHECLPDGWPQVEQAGTPRQVQAYGTGQRLPEGVRAHLGSALTPSGTFVWHLFQLPREEPTP